MVYRPRRLLVPALLALLLSGCGAATPVAATQPAAATPSGSAPPSAGPGPSTGAPSEITLAFAGDVHFEGRTAGLLRNPGTAFGPIATALSDADLTMLNLETAITARGTAEPKEFHFRTTPAALDAVRAAGIDLVTLANNHVLDYGQVGFADTLAAVKASKLPYVGIGMDADQAWAPYVATIKGRRIAFLGVSQVNELASTWVATATRPGEAHAIDIGRTVAAVTAAKRLADIVVVFMHWGTEGDSCPNADQRSLTPKLAAAGADIIIGSHVHTLQGSGWLGRTFVAYGMGNFLWWGASHSTQTGILRLTLHPDRPLSAQFLPAVVSATGQPVLATGADATSIAARFASLRACAGLAAAPAGTA